MIAIVTSGLFVCLPGYVCLFVSSAASTQMRCELTLWLHSITVRYVLCVVCCVRPSVRPCVCLSVPCSSSAASNTTRAEH